MIIYGINPVLEALKAGRVVRVRVGPRHDARLQQVLTLAASRHVPVDRVDSAALDRASGQGVHQGVVAELTPPRDFSLEELVRGATGPPLLVVLDGIEDPHNVGAIVRTVDAAGAHGVIRQTRRAAALDAVAAKASAGAVAHVPIVDVVNIARAIEELKALNVWTVGLAGDAEQSVRRDRFHAADRDRSWRRGLRITTPRPRVVRLHGVDPDERPRRKPERVGGSRRRAVRGGASAAERKSASPRYRCRLSHFGLESSRASHS